MHTCMYILYCGMYTYVYIHYIICDGPVSYTYVRNYVNV